MMGLAGGADSRSGRGKQAELEPVHPDRAATARGVAVTRESERQRRKSGPSRGVIANPWARNLLVL